MGASLGKTKEFTIYSFKRRLLSLESSIATEDKIVTLMRRIEALETKEPTNINQINPPPIHDLGCSYCQAPNYVLSLIHI